ncbi:hypothetical protein CRE_18691 [Caenorhabditis remanei]|uniref:Uncharacterized protein n=1 Tax=Caenorhabditis remanei TaxID=31234 RepID=E3LL61_CAERE|nr:hypothetical protein CRE_18691 [Caenorhabditis remanei]
MRFPHSSYYSNPKKTNYFKKVLTFPGTWAVLIVFTYHYMTWKKVDLLIIPYPPAKIQFNTSRKYLSSNLASIAQLGNHIFEFAGLYGIAKKLNRIPTFFIENGHHKKMLERAMNTMPGLVDKFLIINGSVPDSIRNTSFHGVCCTYDNPIRLEKNPDEYLHLTGIFYQSWKYFPGMREEFLSFLSNSAENSNFGNLPRSDANTHVTCIHARRGDFLEVGFYGADPVFIRNAMKFIDDREKDTRPNKKIVIFGDDAKFMKKVFDGSVYSTDGVKEANHYVSKNTPTADFIYSKYHCDVVLISAPHSTFGWWMGYFSKGQKVYHMDIRFTNDWVYEKGEINIKDFYLPHWQALKFQNSDNLTVVESL